MAPSRKLSPEDAAACIRARGVRYIDDSGLDRACPAYALGMRFVESMRNAETARTYGLHLNRLFTWCGRTGRDPLAMSQLDAAEYDAQLPTAWAEKTRKTNIAVVRAFFTIASKEGDGRPNPFRYFKVSAEPETETPALTSLEINRVLNLIADIADPSIGDMRDYALIFTGGRVGPRRKELARLVFSDLLTAGDGLDARLHRKGGGVDRIVLPPDAIAVLEEWRGRLEAYLGRQVRPNEPVFPSAGFRDCRLRAARRGSLEPLAPGRITSMVRDRFADAGLVGPRMATHVLRASAATIAWEHGATIEEIKLMLGHRHVATTWLYIRRISRPNPATRWSLDVRPMPGSPVPVAAPDPCAAASAEVLDRSQRPGETPAPSRLRRAIRRLGRSAA
jgi:site-specific recombinase XerD